MTASVAGSSSWECPRETTSTKAKKTMETLGQPTGSTRRTRPKSPLTPARCCSSGAGMDGDGSFTMSEVVGFHSQGTSIDVGAGYGCDIR